MPEQPWVGKKSIPAVDLVDLPISITVTDQDGHTVLDYTFERNPDQVELDEQEVTDSPLDSQGLYKLGLSHENFDNRESAILAYRRAIALADENGEAHFQLGLMLLRSADFSNARQHMSRAVELGLNDGYYYLGLLGLLEGSLDAARDAFLLVLANTSLAYAACSGLGLVAMHKEDWQEAVSYFQKSSAMDERPYSAASLLGIALRKAERLDEARSQFEGLLKIDPLNHTALREMSLLDPSGSFRDRLERMHADDRQYILDLACFYAVSGLPEDAVSVILESSSNLRYPMAGYLVAYFLHILKHDSEAQDWLEKAEQLSPDYVFPSRLEEVQALWYALEQNPQDHKAHYYLGNFLYAHQRYEEAVQEWTDSLPGLGSFGVVYRNLGWAAWKRQGNITLAIDLFERALGINPNNQDLYIHLDELYTALNKGEKREQLLQKMESLTAPREDVRKRTIQVKVELGRYVEALHQMKTQKFVPLEMDQSFHNLYVKALLLRARDHMDAGQVVKAIQDYREALDYPSNLGVGKPVTRSHAHVYYLLGVANEKLGRFREALQAWQDGASEHHPKGTPLFEYVQLCLDKLGRYDELGFEI